MYIFPMIDRFPNLKHINLEYTRIEANHSAFNQQLQSVLGRNITVVLTGTQFASFDNKAWFNDSHTFNLSCAEKLLWIHPAHLEMRGWAIYFTGRADEKEIIRAVYNFHNLHYRIKQT